WKLRVLQIPVVLMVLWSLLPVGKVIVDDFIARQQFPLLSGFETSFEPTRWSGSVKRKVHHDIYFSGRSSLQVKLTTQRYSGIGLKDFPADWSGYQAVSLQVFNPDQHPLQLHFRIHDQFHRIHKNVYGDRYNASFELKPGWNQLLVSLDKVAHAPKGRLLDLTRIAGMGVFVGKLDQPRTIYLDDVKLIP
ncbi:MAG: CIA30 family protein, partial [Desulfuromusa sp.]|nr:CIA30 family protein [Desulfuromusa sp.]